MTDRDPDSSRNLLEGKQNNLHRVNNCAMKSEKYLEDYERLRSKLAQITCYLYGLAAVVVAGMLILIVIVAVLYGKLSYDVAHHSHQPKVGEQIAKILERGKLCLPCNELRLGPSPEEENMLNKFTREEHDNVEKCCVETPSQLLELLELVSLLYMKYIFHPTHPHIHCYNTSTVTEHRTSIGICTIGVP